MAFTSDRRLYLSRDKSRVVEHGDSSAAFLFAAPGQEIPDADAKAYGLDWRDGKVILPAEKQPKSEEKTREKSEDKSREKAEDKSAKKTAGKK